MYMELKRHKCIFVDDLYGLYVVRINSSIRLSTFCNSHASENLGTFPKYFESYISRVLVYVTFY